MLAGPQSVFQASARPYAATGRPAPAASLRTATNDRFRHSFRSGRGLEPQVSNGSLPRTPVDTWCSYCSVEPDNGRSRHDDDYGFGALIGLGRI